MMPKYNFPQKEHDPRPAYQVVHDELMMDGDIAIITQGKWKIGVRFCILASRH